MARGSGPQLPMSFARPRKKKGGLVMHDYRELVERLRADATRVAEHFDLPPFELDADRPDARGRYGLCFDDGRIRVRLSHVRTGRALRYAPQPRRSAPAVVSATPTTQPAQLVLFSGRR